jgi:hypothetical protein
MSSTMLPVMLFRQPKRPQVLLRHSLQRMAQVWTTLLRLLL